MSDVVWPRAIYRFYAELIELLTERDEFGVVVRTFDESPSVKDQIEACGVPHTEVDLILANGESVGFDYQIRDGDRISVYPLFRVLDVGGVTRVRPPELPEPRFVADVNLGKLARYLRLLGFDTVSNGDWSDADLVVIASDHRRTLLTKDRPLLKRSAVTHGYLVRSIQPFDQLLEVVRRFGLLDRMDPFARCMECNGVIQAVAKSDIDHLLEPLTRRYFDEFRQCPECERVFWRGSHHGRLVSIVDRVRANVT